MVAAVALAFASLANVPPLLQQLHVKSFTLTSDTAHPKLNEPFSVTVTINVAENVATLENVYLPTFIGPEELGDERQYAHGPSGTIYRETMTLEAHAAGPLEITSAYLDAVDARDGKPKRFISNSLHLRVGGAPLDLLAPVRALLKFVLELVLLAAAVFVLFSVFRRRGMAAPVQPVAHPQPAPAPIVSPGMRLDAALKDLERLRTRSALLRVRDALWQLAGAGTGETLNDVLVRPQAKDPALQRMLVLVERAAFVEDAQFDGAVADVLAYRERSFA